MTQPTETEEVVTQEPSLDDVISEYNVQSVPEPAPVVSKEPETPSIPMNVDPLDEKSFNNYATQVAQGQSVLGNQLNEVKSELTQLRQERAELQIESDINDAVGKLNDGLDLNPKLVRVHLEYTAQEKPGFKKIWDNRKQNPKAYEKALEAISKEMKGTYSMKQDPELTATQKAVQQSQQSLATTAKDGSERSFQK